MDARQLLQMPIERQACYGLFRFTDAVAAKDFAGRSAALFLVFHAEDENLLVAPACLARELTKLGYERAA